MRWVHFPLKRVTQRWYFLSISHIHHPAPEKENAIGHDLWREKTLHSLERLASLDFPGPSAVWAGVKRPFFFLFAEGWENRCEDVSGTNIWLRAWAGKQMGPLQVCGYHSGKKGDMSAIGLPCACSWFYSYSSSVCSWRWEFRGSSQGSESVHDVLRLQSW